jgi:hypothetical protein
VDILSGMSPAFLLVTAALSLGQVPAGAPDASNPPPQSQEAAGFGGPDVDAAAVAADMAADNAWQIQELTRRVEELEAQLAERASEAQQAAQRTQALGQELGALEDRSRDLELARRERIALLEQTGAALLDAEAFLDEGELEEASGSVAQADAALASAEGSSAQAGNSLTRARVAGARELLQVAAIALARDDGHVARGALISAAQQVGEARLHALGHGGASALVPPEDGR